MKRNKIYAAFAIASLGLVACEDMDTNPQGEYVTSDGKGEIIANDPSRVSASVNAIFSQFSQAFPNTTAIGENHADIGYPSIMMFTDANTDDMVSDDTGYNWANNSLSYDDRMYTSSESQMVWNDYYKIIYCANTAIELANPESEDPEVVFYAAQGYAARAFAYFELAQLYQYTYVGHEDALCVPIVTEKNRDQVAEDNSAPRATVREVYEQVYSDLNYAIELLEVAAENGFERNSAKSYIGGEDKRYFDIATAYGLRARVNLVCQKWSAAANDASMAIEMSSAEPATIEDVNHPTFWSAKENNWMWAIMVDEKDDVVETAICNWISHTGTFNYGYGEFSGGRRISKKLFDSISESDVRKGWWIDEDYYSPNLTPNELAYLGWYGFEAYTHVKFAAYQDNKLEQEVNANDMPLMRIEEMYLIKAEAEAMSGGDGAGALSDFAQTYRDPEFVLEGDVQEECLRQRRIEFWGEGRIWFDIMRLNKGIDRRGAGFAPSYVYVIAPDDPNMLWRIPQVEVEANKGISNADNNPVGAGLLPVSDWDEEE